MTEELIFTKMTAAGNDFICTDGRLPAARELLRAPNVGLWVQRLCRHGLGVGADGLIVADRPNPGVFAAVAARFFDPDGSAVELCGNGTACLTEWAIASGLVEGPDVVIQTPAGLAQGKRVPGSVGRIRVCIPTPLDVALHRKVEAGDRVWSVHTAVTGVPHGVIQVGDELKDLDVALYGRLLRQHAEFAPRGINVNFVQIHDVGRIAVRTFEFGVEAETLACGTGCATAAFITAMLQDWPAAYREGDEPVLIDVRGGETLKVWFTIHPVSGEVGSVCLETRVRPVYEGRMKAAFFVP